MSAPAADLLQRAAALVDISSPSHHEAAVADRLEAELASVPWLKVDRIGSNVVARTNLGRARRVLLGGHIDTVPPQGNQRAHMEGGVLWGVGAADMKGGIAIMTELARTIEDPPSDVTYLLYACEEVDRRFSGLGQVAREQPDLLSADAAILAEPSGGRVEVGCQGTMRAVVKLAGQRAHTARAWMGRNAIHRLARLLEVVASWQGRQPVIEGCQYREGLQAVGVEGGVASNVVPDEVRLVLNHRFAPDTTEAVAEGRLRQLLDDLLEPGDSLEIEEAAPGAMPHLRHSLVADLVARTGAPPRAKLGWTDVAFFAQRGVPAANFGPGDPSVAHSPMERVTRAELEAAYSVLVGVLNEGAWLDGAPPG